MHAHEACETGFFFEESSLLTVWVRGTMAFVLHESPRRVMLLTCCVITTDFVLTRHYMNMCSFSIIGCYPELSGSRLRVKCKNGSINNILFLPNLHLVERSFYMNVFFVVMFFFRSSVKR